MPNTGLARALVSYNDAYSKTWIEYLSPREWRGRVTVEYRHVPMAQIDGAGSLMVWQTLEGWYLALVHGRAIPPIVVHEKEDGRFYAHDGNHRLEALAHYFGGRPETPVRVAIARPRNGWAFRRTVFDSYVTYCLVEDVPEELGPPGPAMETMPSDLSAR